VIGPKDLDSVIQSAQGLGALSASAVWALVCLYFVWRDYQRDKQVKKTTEEWMKIRTEDAKADLLAANALNGIVDRLGRIETTQVRIQALMEK
jgi:hypothetical protein